MRYFLAITITVLLTLPAAAHAEVPPEILGREFPATTSTPVADGTENGSWIVQSVGTVAIEATDTIEASSDLYRVRTESGTGQLVWDESRCGTSLTASGTSWPPGTINCGSYVWLPGTCYKFKRFHPLNLIKPYMYGSLTCFLDASGERREYTPMGTISSDYGTIHVDEEFNKPDCPRRQGDTITGAAPRTGHPAFWADIELMRSTCNMIPYEQAMREAREAVTARPGSNVTQACRTEIANPNRWAYYKVKGEWCTTAGTVIFMFAGEGRSYKKYKCKKKLKRGTYHARCTKGKAVITATWAKTTNKDIR